MAASCQECRATLSSRVERVTGPSERITLPDYRPPGYDDAVEGDGAVRPWAREALAAVRAHDLAALGRDVRRDVTEMGIRFTSVDGDDSWHVDPVPRTIPAAEWEELARGLAQRARALNAFVADAYAEQRIVAEGAVPRRVLETAENFETGMVGVRPGDGVWTAITGLDLVRDQHGRWLVLEDNVRTPSGFGYWWAAREATCRRLGLDGPRRPPALDELAGMLAATLGPGRAVVLTDGPDNSAYWEHRWAAERLGVPLVETGDLEQRGDRLFHDDEPVDAVYRRSDDDTLDTAAGRVLHPVLCAGGVKVVNCFGTGVADDKLAHAYVPAMVRFYLGEEPLLGSVETFDLADPDMLEHALDVFDELVVKDRESYGGMGVVVVGHADADDVATLRERVRADPGAFVAQRRVPLSTHPTEIDGELRPRHVDLRPFVFLAGPHDARVSPGGITRVALDEGALVVNSTQNGGAKDTWVVP
jgi:uncharacterized circularly permuted ATP-grasp superfamily protein